MLAFNVVVVVECRRDVSGGGGVGPLQRGGEEEISNILLFSYLLFIPPMIWGL